MRVSTTTDEELIRGFREGQANQCFQLLYERYNQKVYQQCLKMTRDQNTAQDFTHDIFLKLFDKVTDFRGQARLSTARRPGWLYSITRHYCLDQLRLAGRLPQQELSVELEQLAVDESTSFLDEQLVSEAWQSLCPQKQRILVMKYEEGLSYEVIADQLKLPISTLKMRTLRARQGLKRHYVRLADI